MGPEESMPPKTSRKLFWAGWVLSVVPMPMFLMSATMKFTQPAEAVKGFEHLGWPIAKAAPLGIVELGCLVVYLVPQTSVLGAILLTGYLGGAVATHVRAGDPISNFAIPIVLGILLWGGLFLRDARIRVLIPFRR